MSEDFNKIRDAEKKAFEHAAGLVHYYRSELKAFKFISAAEAVIIVVLYVLLLWR